MNETAAPKFAVIATRIPYIDRRSLSEAWFSTLRLASDGPPPAQAGDRRAGSSGPLGSRPPRLQGANTTASAAMQTQRSVALPSRSALARAEITTRRAYDARAASAARETYQRARSYPPFRSALTLGSKGERVQLLLRREGATLHVVALCRPEMRETVARALACADAHLRMRGESVRSSVELLAAEPVASEAGDA